DHVGNQEKRGGAECREHASPMRGHVFVPDLAVARRQKNCADGVEGRVERRKVGEGHTAPAAEDRRTSRKLASPASMPKAAMMPTEKPMLEGAAGRFARARLRASMP